MYPPPEERASAVALGNYFDEGEAAAAASALDECAAVSLLTASDGVSNPTSPRRPGSRRNLFGQPVWRDEESESERDDSSSDSES